MNQVLDCMGMACPLPLVNAKKAVEAFAGEGTLTVKVDNEIAVQNLTRFAEHKGFPVRSEKVSDKEFAVVMEVTEAGKQQTASNATSEGAGASADTLACTPDARRRDTVVVLSADTMGTGDEVLGKKLMNAFIFAMTNADTLPDTIICYNRGAFLSIEGSESLQDLKSLEAAGVKIMTCGTCLDYYGIKDKLGVGIISNMYDIVSTQMNAGTILRP